LVVQVKLDISVFILDYILPKSSATMNTMCGGFDSTISEHNKKAKIYNPYL